MHPECPSADVLAAFVEGRLSPAEIAHVEAHASGCDTCPQVLGLLAGGERDLQRGDTVDRYQILEKVGRGAFGTVYAAYDPKLDRKVALKIIPRAGADSEERMLREARAMARVSSPHVVTVHDVGTLPTCVYAAMDFVDGQTLRAWLDAGRTVPQIVDAFVQAGRGLAAAHAVGIVHRDFKPENVLVHGDGRVAVTDFGLARSGPIGVSGPHDPRASQSAIGGTPQFMAPEVLRGGPATAASDVYAFCVALYAALYGAHPFDLAGFDSLEDAWADGPRIPPRVGWVSRPMRDVVLAGLAADPAQRPASIEAVLAGLSPRRGRWGLVAAGGLAAVALAAWLWPTGLAECRSAELGWDGARRAAVEQALRATGHPAAGDTWARLAPQLDRYAARWSAQWAEACAAPADERAEARVSCLDERRERFATLLEQLGAVDREGVDFAAAAAFALPSVEVCQGPTRAEALPARAYDLRATLDRARTLRDLGRAEDGLAALAPAVIQAHELGDPGVEAEVLLAQGDLLMLTDPQAAVTALHSAGAAASAAGRLDLEAQAKVLLVTALTMTQTSDEKVSVELAYAEALVQRLGDPVLSAELLHARARMNTVTRQRADLSLADDEAYLAATRALYGPEHPKVAEALDALASTYLQITRDAEALRLQQEALDLRIALHGPDHPGTIVARANLSLAHLDTGQIERAVALALENVASARRGLRPNESARTVALHRATECCSPAPGGRSRRWR